MNERTEGTIQRLNPTYGFIRDQRGKDYFFLPKEVTGDYEFGQLKVGWQVSFEIEEHPRGQRARQVEIQRVTAGA